MASSATHIYNEVLGLGVGQIQLSGSFIWSGSAITGVRGKGFTVTRTGTGTFNVTFDVPYRSILSANASQNPNANPSGHTPNAVPNADLDATGQIMTLWTLNSSGNAADPAPTTRVCFEAILSSSQLNS